MEASRFATFLETFDPDVNIRGTQWEHVCKWFLETDPVYRGQLTKVWLWKKWPGRWGPDAGIDLVAETKDGKLWAIQAKHYAPDNTVTKQEMDSFLAESGRPEFSYRLLIATTRKLSSNATRACKNAAIPASTRPAKPAPTIMKSYLSDIGRSARLDRCIGRTIIHE